MHITCKVDVSESPNNFVVVTTNQLAIEFVSVSYEITSDPSVHEFPGEQDGILDDGVNNEEIEEPTKITNSAAFTKVCGHVLPGISQFVVLDPPDGPSREAGHVF